MTRFTKTMAMTRNQARFLVRPPTSTCIYRLRPVFIKWPNLARNCRGFFNRNHSYFFMSTTNEHVAQLSSGFSATLIATNLMTKIAKSKETKTSSITPIHRFNDRQKYIFNVFHRRCLRIYYIFPRIKRNNRILCKHLSVNYELFGVFFQHSMTNFYVKITILNHTC